MPMSVNGIGTKYYGARSRLPDGSYITTEWLIVFYIPVFPVGSYRVRPVGGANYFIYTSEKYRSLRVPLCRPQVRDTYLMLAAVIAIFLPLLIFWGHETVFQTYAMIVLFATMIFGLVISRRSRT